MFYGHIVREGPSGVDVSRCGMTTVVVKDMVNVEYAAVRRCIRSVFGSAMNGKKMTLEAFVVEGGNRWVLRRVTGERAWASYMGFASNPNNSMYGQPMVYVEFISASDVAECSSGAGEAELAITVAPDAGPTEPTGGQQVYDTGYWSAVVDMSEHVEGLPEALDDDDDGHSSASSESDDDEVVPPENAVAAAINPEFLQVMSITNEFHSVAGLDAGSLAVGQIFPDKKSAKQAIHSYAIAIHRQHRVKQSDKKELKLICIHREAGCRGRVIARQKPGVCQPWHVTKIEQHGCEQTGTLSEHRNVTAEYVSQVMQTIVQQSLNISIRALRATASDLIGFPVSYSKARHAKEKIFQRLYGTYEEAYSFAPRMLHQISVANRGTQVFRKERPNPLNPDEQILDRLFWAFAQTIQAFKHCRPVVSIDGTFLTGKYKGTLLVAMAADANNQLLPIAYALVESENKHSWLWFLCCLKMGVIKDREGVCIISDRNTGLLSALEIIKASQDPDWGWPDLETRWCMRHLAANFYSKFKNKDWFKLFKRMCMQKTTAKMNAIWAGINGQIERASLPAREDRRGRRTAINLSQWINENCPNLYKWAQSQDTGARYGIMTSNMSEVYNGVLKGVRALPITALIDETWNRTVSYFADRVTVAKALVDLNKTWSEKMQRHLDDKAKKSQRHGCRQVDALRNKWEVSVRAKFVKGHHRGAKKQAVTLGATSCECTCNKPKLLGYPCSHVLRAAADQQISVEPYVSPYFNMHNLYNTWNGEFWAWGIDTNYKQLWPEGTTWVPDPALMRTSKGRRQSRRHRNDMDHSQLGEPRRCRVCRCAGHSRRECPYRNNNTA